MTERIEAEIKVLEDEFRALHCKVLHGEIEMSHERLSEIRKNMKETIACMREQAEEGGPREA